MKNRDWNIVETLHFLRYSRNFTKADGKKINFMLHLLPGPLQNCALGESVRPIPYALYLTL